MTDRLAAGSVSKPSPKRLNYNATLLRRVDFTPKLAAFHVRYDEPLGSDAAFVPGQYVALGLNNEARPELGSVRRSMSIASAPESRDALEFYVRFVERPESSNPLTHLLWKMTDGDRLFVTRRPTGKFTLRDTLGEGSPRLHVLVAAGTGLAPFLSMIRSMKIRAPNGDMSRIALIHGASYPADHGYVGELTRCVAENGLRYFRTVSRPLEARGWTGDVGRAEDYFLPERLEDFERRAGLSRGELTPRAAGVLVCGLRGTIARCVERLAVRGFVPYHSRIRKALGVVENLPASLWWEQYDTEPVIDVTNEAALGSLKRSLALGLARASEA